MVNEFIVVSFFRLVDPIKSRSVLLAFIIHDVVKRFAVLTYIGIDERLDRMLVYVNARGAYVILKLRDLRGGSS